MYVINVRQFTFCRVHNKSQQNSNFKRLSQKNSKAIYLSFMDNNKNDYNITIKCLITKNKNLNFYVTVFQFT